MKHLLHAILTTVFLFSFSYEASADHPPKKIIDGKPVVRLATLNWAPHYAEDLPNQGYFTEIVKESFLRVGYKLDVSFVPWKRAFVQASKGKYDGLLGAYHTEDRTKNFLFSSKISQAEIVLLSLKKRNIEANNLKALSQHQIGFLRGSSGGSKFDKASFLNKVPADDQSLNMSKLLFGRIDLLLIGKLHALKILNERFPNNRQEILLHTPALESNGLYVAISKKVEHSAKLILEFNKGLKIIKKEGTFDSIIKKHELNDNFLTATEKDS